MIKININLKYNSYTVFIKSNIFYDVVNFHKENYTDCKAIIITDNNVKKLYLNNLIKKFVQNNISPKKYIVGVGENSKSFNVLENLANKILTSGINRNDIIYALGGGVVGDLTGFLSSILLRGIKYIQIPTTLLSQVDSSVGGKTGINTKVGKNLIGSFFQPTAVFIDPNTLKTLSKKEFLAGYSEVVKYSLINDKLFFEWLCRNLKNTYSIESKKIIKIISTCVRKKANIVKLDEKENNARMLLNLGHTFAHAIENELKYKIRHGEAVSVGMLMAMKLSNKLGYASSKDYMLLENHLKKINLPVRLKQLSNKKKWFTKNLLKNMKSDKKSYKGNIQFILCRGIGKAFIKKNIDIKLITETIEDLKN